MKTRDFRSFSEFWPYYISQHSKAGTRWLHFVGNTNLFFWFALAAINLSWKMALFAVVSSYGFAWVGHFFVERNIPATFRYPIKAGMGDMLMYYKMIRGTLDEDLKKYLTDV
jgi:hypothetical protein